MIECFCCYEKALEYDEYDDLLDHSETQGQKCVTLHPDFQDNMLSESVLKIDVCRYLEENYPLDDEDLERVHRLYRLVAYQRCFPDFTCHYERMHKCMHTEIIECSIICSVY